MWPSKKIKNKTTNQITHAPRTPLSHGAPPVRLIQTHRHNPRLSGPLIYKARGDGNQTSDRGHKRSGTFPVISRARQADSSGEEEQEEEEQEEEEESRAKRGFTLRDMKDKEGGRKGGEM